MDAKSSAGNYTELGWQADDRSGLRQQRRTSSTDGFGRDARNDPRDAGATISFSAHSSICPAFQNERRRIFFVG
jgi:hypothetical protein